MSITKKVKEIIKIIIFYISNYVRKVLYCACCIFPIRKDAILVNCFDGKGYGDNPKYIINKLIEKKNDLHILWLYNGVSDEGSIISQIKYVRPYSIKAIFYQATSKIWISTVRMPLFSIKRKNQFYIQVWHGSIGFKKVERECENALPKGYISKAKHDSKMIDYYISSNDDLTYVFQTYFWKTGGEILKYGAPRNDMFYDQSIISQSDLSVEKDINTKFVLYAPTFRSDNSFSAYDIDLNALLKSLSIHWGGKWKVIVRLHPRLSAKSEKFMKYGEDIIDGSKIDSIQELLTIIDLVITDYSSIAFDYMIQRKPVLLYASDIEAYVNDRDFHIDYFSTPFLIATTQQELDEAIANFSSEVYLSKVERFIKQVGFYDDGHASERCADLIIKLLN